MTENQQNFEENMKKAQQDTVNAFPNPGQSAQQLKDLNERMLESTKSAGRVALNAYERSVQSILDFQRSMVGNVSHEGMVGQFSHAYSVQLQLMQDITDAYIKACREFMK